MFKDKAGTSIRHTMMGTMREYGTEKFQHITKAWDETQQAVSSKDLVHVGNGSGNVGSQRHGSIEVQSGPEIMSGEIFAALGYTWMLIIT